jgi:Histidine kinase-, DNA gyrase B-, and HSP90-like ATPase
LPVALDLQVEGELSDGVEVAAYYAVSELITNTAKHAQASSIDVAVTTVDGVLRIVARDDGIGGADPARGSGLIGLRDRIEALGGTFSVRSPKGEGTAVEARSHSTANVTEPTTCTTSWSHVRHFGVDLPARGAPGRSLTQRRRPLKVQLTWCRQAAWYRPVDP